MPWPGVLAQWEQPWLVVQLRQPEPLSFQNLLGQQELLRPVQASWRFQPAWSPLPAEWPEQPQPAPFPQVEWMAQALQVRQPFRARTGPLSAELRPELPQRERRQRE